MKKAQNYNSYEEFLFYEQTTKRQMFLIIQQMAELLKDNQHSWVCKAIDEKKLLKINGIK